MKTGVAEFTTTRWSLILRAGKWESEEGPAAMEEFCRLYWLPLYVFVRRKGYAPADAADLTQDFFVKLLRTGFPANVKREGGRLRSYLLTGLSRFLINESEKRSRQKRGGNSEIISLDALIGERGETVYTQMPQKDDAERLFQRSWAEALLNRVSQRLEQECHDRNDRRFEVLKPFLSAQGEPPTIAAAALQLGLGISAFKSLLHRLRQRYREILFSEVAATLSDPAEIQGEIRAIIQLLRD